ncbi:hypothetical protein AB6806_27735 [Bosea sp. RCC_152_1]|uniref:hypothetical protein n=1 Tax=Bosea sp. RCC_152_1 TaxID=3239228 RepID=UPI003526070B
MTAPLNAASLASEIRRRAVRREWTGDPIDGGVSWIEHNDPFLTSVADALESTSRTLSEKEACERAFLDELGDPAIDGWNSAAEKLKAVLDAVEENEQSDQVAQAEATRQRDEALAALKASEERGERLSQELASARLRPETWQDVTSAPEDEWMLVATTGGWVGEAMHIAGDWKWASGHVFHSDIVPLKWMPLPEHFEALENGPAALADATNKDPGTEQREAGR